MRILVASSHLGPNEIIIIVGDSFNSNAILDDVAEEEISTSQSKELSGSNLYIDGRDVHDSIYLC